MRCQEHYYNPPAQPDEITCDVCLREACDHYTPTEAEEQIVKLRVRIKELEARLEKVKARHPAKTTTASGAPAACDWCHECDLVWPCPTYRAAEGKP